MSGDKKSGDKTSRDKTYMGQNVHRDKMSWDEISVETKHPEGQNVLL
jgi:hypothetical protein